MTARITDLVGTTDALARVFSDEAVVRAMLDVEAALARAEAAAGVIPKAAADVITRAAHAADLDFPALVRDGRAAGTIAVPLVRAFTARVREIDADAARFVHWGATSQDIVDTATALLAARAVDVMAADHARLASALRALSDRHAGDLMLGRTLLQPAPPITFGLKVAGWYAAEGRSWARIEQARREASVVQFGGASGTLAALDDRGLAVADALGREIGLASPAAPWHAHQDRFAALVAACGIHTGALGKMARDVSLLMQMEVGEAAEPGGASSTMPHKQNPVGCAVALAAAVRLPGLVSSALSALVQEHERAVGGWHAGLPILAEALQVSGAALDAMAGVAADLHVDAARMRANLDRANGTVFAERAMMRAGAELARDRAYDLLKRVLADSRATNEPFATALRREPELAAALGDEDLRAIDDPAAYLGVAETLRRRLLASVTEG